MNGYRLNDQEYIPISLETRKRYEEFNIIGIVIICNVSNTITEIFGY